MEAKRDPLAWDMALCISSSLGWVVAGVLVLLPSLYYVVLHVLAIAGFFAIATSSTARQMGADLQRGLSEVMSHHVGDLVTRRLSAPHTPATAPTPIHAPVPAPPP
jgi:hypothetical protein